MLRLLLQPADQNVSRGRAEPGRAGQAAGQHHPQIQGGASPLRETRAASAGHRALWGDPGSRALLPLVFAGSSLLRFAACISLWDPTG